jgi:TRAP-type C4-dicarboxylate transport system substrate-binding protein
MNGRSTRLAPLMGAAFFVLAIAGFVISGEPPDAKESVPKVVDFYVNNDSKVMLGAAISVIAGTCLVFFSAHLRKVLRAAEGDDGLLPQVAFAGGVIVAIAIAVDRTMLFAVAATAKDIDPLGVQTLNALYGNDFLPFALGMQVLLLATGISVIRSRALPRWLGWVAVVLGAVAVSPLGLATLVGGGLWILTASVVMGVRAGRRVPVKLAPGAAAGTIALLSLALAGVGLAGCSSAKQSAGADTGKSVTLRIGTDDEPGKPASDQIQEFARRVDKASGGKLRIKPVWHAAGDGPNWDQRVARMVSGNQLDMGLIPSRSWDTEGVTSLRALNAPFLITSDKLLDEVISSGSLVGDLMSGLDKAGVIGIALFPEGLRHPFGLKQPLLGPADYRGKTIRAATSKTTAAVYKSLGASVNDADEDPSIHAAVDSSYLLDPGGTATGNVTFYPKVNSLVANAAVYKRLDHGQRKILQQAALETRKWAIDSEPTDAQAAKGFCAQGGAVVLASATDVGALEKATAPVYAALGRDQQTKRAIAAIRELKQRSDAAATAPAACGSGAGGANVKTVDGRYRFEITDAQLRTAGVTSATDIAENHGVYTVSLSQGDYCWKQQAPNHLDNPNECGTYDADGHQLVWHFPSGPPEIYGYRKAATGDLELTVVRGTPGEEAFARAWTVNTWKRIGEAK